MVETGVPDITPVIGENFKPPGNFGYILNERWSCSFVPY